MNEWKKTGDKLCDLCHPSLNGRFALSRVSNSRISGIRNPHGDDGTTQNSKTDTSTRCVLPADTGAASVVAGCVALLRYEVAHPGLYCPNTLLDRGGSDIYPAHLVRVVFLPRKCVLSSFLLFGVRELTELPAAVRTTLRALLVFVQAFSRELLGVH